LNALILKAYRRSTGKRAGLHQSGDGKDADEARKELTKANQLTRMLLLISVTFIITVAPHRIGRSLNTFFPQTTVVGIVVVDTIRRFNNRFWFVNNAINFYLYVCGGGQRFRKDLMMIFC
jgi:hypothetical protein